MTIELFFAEDPTSDVFSPNGPEWYVLTVCLGVRCPWTTVSFIDFLWRPPVPSL